MQPAKLNPPHYLLLAIIAMLALDLIPAEPLLSRPWFWVGTFVLIFGVMCTVQAALWFRKAGTNLRPFTESTALVTNGLFAHTRNPMYLGMIIALAGLALILNERWPWLVLPAFAAVIQYRFIHFEEQLMEQTFGDDYRTYKSRVRRWL